MFESVINTKPAVFFKFTETIGKEKIDLENLEKAPELFKGDAELAAALLDYKNKTYSPEYVEEIERKKTEETLRINEKTLADWEREYTIIDLGDGYELTDYKGDDIKVVVPGQIGQKPVLRLNKTFKGLDLIEEVIVSENVIDIGAETFKNCRALRKVKLPESLITIGDEAFYGCEVLSAILIPAYVKEIGDNTFKDCAPEFETTYGAFTPQLNTMISVLRDIGVIKKY